MNKTGLFEQLALNTVCFSDDEKKLYGLSEYYNELFEIDMESNTTVSLGRLGDEDDNDHMFSQIVYCCEKLLCIPRKAENFYIYDIKTGYQTALAQNKLSDQVSIGIHSFAYIKYKKFVYAIYREYMLAYRIDMENCVLEKINSPFENKYIFAPMSASYGNILILYSTKTGRLFSFCAETERMEEIQLDKKIASCGRIYFDGDRVWIYCIETGTIYHCRIRDGKLHSIDLNVKGRKAIAFLKKDNDLMYLLLQGDNYFVCDKENAQIKKYPQNDIYYKMLLDSMYFRYAISRKNGMGSYKVGYFKLDIETMRFHDFMIPLPKNQSPSYIRNKMLKIYGGKPITENRVFSLPFFIELCAEQNNDLV